MSDAKRDDNFVPTLLAVSSVDGTTPVRVYANPTTHRLLVDIPSGSGTVSDVSVVSANGFAGTVATSTTTPAITLSTTITGILKGNGTAISAAGAGDVDSILPTQTGNNGKYLTTNGTVSSWATVAGGGDVTKVGTPVNNQIGVWTGDGTIEGDADFTWSGTQLDIAGSQTITVADATNVVGLTINQNDVTNNPSALSIVTAGTGNPLLLSSTHIGGNLTAADFYYNNASHANGDFIDFEFNFNNSAGTKTLFAFIDAIVGDETAGSEDAYLSIGVKRAGINRSMLRVGAEGTDAINGIAVGNSTVGAGVLTSSGDQDLILQTGNATTGSITIADGANGLITAAPNGASGEFNVKNSTSVGNENFYAYSGNGSAGFGADDGAGSYVDAYAVTGSTYLKIADDDAGSVGPILYFHHNSATPAANDIIAQIRFNGEDSASGEQTYARIQGVIADTTSTSEDGILKFGVVTAGTVAEELELIGSALYPTTNDGLQLGNTTNQFSDLFLAEGGVINFDNGDVTVTQTGNVLAVAGGDLRVATADVGTNADSVPTISSTNTLTNKRITKRVGSTTSSATPTINTDLYDAYHLTAQTADITSFTTNLSGTPTDFQQLRISVTGTAARAITWGASFANGPVALPTTTVTTTRLDVLLEWDSVTSKWRCMASGSTV